MNRNDSYSLAKHIPQTDMYMGHQLIYLKLGLHRHMKLAQVSLYRKDGVWWLVTGTLMHYLRVLFVGYFYFRSMIYEVKKFKSVSQAIVIP